MYISQIVKKWAKVLWNIDVLAHARWLSFSYKYTCACLWIELHGMINNPSLKFAFWSICVYTVHEYLRKISLSF